jgi:outer membrane lipoprotein SlyB
MEVKVAGRVSGGAIVAKPTTSKSYEITVRFRDGSTTVFNETGSRTWRLGARVIMIGRSIASN